MSLEEFNFNQLLPIKRDDSTNYNTIALIGPSFSGKTHNILRIVMFYLSKNVIKPENIHLFKNSEALENKYPEFMFPNKYQFDEEKLANILINREKFALKYGKDDLANSMIILDDVTERKQEARRSAVIEKLIYAGRHYRITTILSYHDFTFINKNPRTSINIFMFTKVDSRDIIDWSKKYDLKNSIADIEKMFVLNSSLPSKGIYKTIVMNRNLDSDQNIWSVITTKN